VETLLDRNHQPLEQVGPGLAGEPRVPGASPDALEPFREAGALAAGQLTDTPRERRGAHALRARSLAMRKALRAVIADRSGVTNPANREWLTDNARLLLTAEKEVREFLLGAREYPAVVNPALANGDAQPHEHDHGHDQDQDHDAAQDHAHDQNHDHTAPPATLTRIGVLASAYLDAASGKFGEETFAAFMNGSQEVHELQLGELWASRPALLVALLDRVLAALTQDQDQLPRAIRSVRRIGEANWKELFEQMSAVDRVLGQEPSGAYWRMDYASRDAYRHIVADLAKHSGKSERDVAAAAVALAESGSLKGDDAAGARRAHVGFYLIDDGIHALKARIGYRAPFARRLSDAILARPTTFYLGTIGAATLFIVAALLNGLTPTPVFAVVFLLLLLPATQAAVEFVNSLMTALVRSKTLPKLDFSDGIPADCTTLVAVPALLLNETHVHELVMDLEIRYLANDDPQLYFALLTDSPDAHQPTEQRRDLVQLAEQLIQELNARYGADGRSPFYLFHRDHVYNPSEGRWMGWERKRGKILDLNRLLRGAFDSFPVKVGDLSVLPGIRYVITLDSDTQLPRDTALKLVGTIAHPLNRAVLDASTKQVVEGYGILQPRVGVSTQSAASSWLARLLAGQTGFDIYTCAVSDVYQDLFGEGSFTGKGIYDVDAFRDALEHRFPENALLSHDLIEGVFARAALVSDIELIDDYPTHFIAYSRRKHRWMRGDWQILRWLMTKVPDSKGQVVENSISAISRWKIVDNLRRSLFEPATLLLLLAGWFVLPEPAYVWTLVSVAMLLMPAYAHLVVSVANAPWGHRGFGAWAKDTVKAFGREHLLIVLHVTYLLHDALLAIDAIVRSLARVFVTRQRLLEWETAAEAQSSSRRKGAADVYLEWGPFLAIAIAVALWIVRPAAMPTAAPVLVLWTAARALAIWLGRAPRNATVNLTAEDDRLLRAHAVRIWRFFREFGQERSNWLVPDHITECGTIAERISPTNLGFLLNARIAAVHMGYLTVPEFARHTANTLEAARKMPTYKGHFPNWVGTDHFQALDPLFLSTVDSGNLAACLWTLKQAALTFSRETADDKAPGNTAPDNEALWRGIRDMAAVIGENSHEPAAHALSECLLHFHGDWKAALPQLEEVARRFAAHATGDTRWWADELITRMERARAWLETGLTPAVSEDLQRIASVADEMVADMDFSFLYNQRKKVLSIGYDVKAEKVDKSTYDLLASEARIANFVAIAKGDVPQESWFHLGRTHVEARGERVLASWTGTLFEYLMPALWMRHHPRTIMRDSMRAVVRLQQTFVRWRAIPWGISESGCVTADGAPYGYAAFGLPDLALKQMDPKALVVSPYSTFLALMVDPRAALANLRHMDRLGWRGRYGLVEAADYSDGAPQLVESWMAHHQGMSLLAVCNVVCGNVLHRDFHAEPLVQATELLLHERVPRGALVNAEKPLVVPSNATVPDESAA
jgi:hypothetical protein